MISFIKRYKSYELLIADRGRKEGSMRIAEAARRLGVHPITLKRIERVGVIDPMRDRNGWRRFDDETIERARRFLYPNEKPKSKK